MTLQAVSELIGKATEADRQLDLLIAIAVWGRPGVLVGRRDPESGATQEHVNWQYTGKIDDALTLVPEGWHAIVNWRDCLDGSSSCTLHEFPVPCRRIPHTQPYVILRPTAALAICEAALRARMLIASDHP